MSSGNHAMELLLSTLRMKPIHIHWARVLPIGLLLTSFMILIYTLMRSASCSTNYLSNPDIKSVMYLCNALNEGPANGDEGSVPTFKYRLEQVHVTIRHGDRFHLHTLPNYDMIHIPCNVSADVIRHVPEMEGYVQTMQENIKHMPPNHPFVNWDLYPNKELCKPSVLTPQGAAQHVRNGAFLKSVYVRKWKLLTAGPDLWDQVEMISTKKSRTLMSGLALLYGLLPDFHLGKLSMHAVDDNRICLPPAPATPDSVHSAVPSGQVECECPSLMRYLNVVAGVYGQWLPTFASKKHVVKMQQEVSAVLGSPVHTLPLTSHIMDVSVVHMCHNLPLPGPPGRSNCFTPATVRSIIDIINHNGVHRLHDPKVQKLSRLKMHPFLQDILARINAIISGKTKRRFYLYSGHDSTIDPLAIALNISDGRWPRYASRIILEIYSTSSNKELTGKQREYFVKVLFDGKDVTGQTRGCEMLAADGLCHYTDFSSALSSEGLKRALGGLSYQTHCNHGVL